MAQKREMEPNENEFMEEMSHEGWEHVEDMALRSMYNESPLVGVPYQGSPQVATEMMGRAAESWYPSIDFACCNQSVPVPQRADHDPRRWARTACELPKLEKLGYYGKSYEELGDRALASYLGWIRSSFERTYMSRGPSSGGPYLAFLAYIRFQVPIDSDGFRRRFV